jgi:hypothetical protein
VQAAPGAERLDGHMAVFGETDHVVREQRLRAEEHHHGRPERGPACGSPFRHSGIYEKKGVRATGKNRPEGPASTLGRSA